MNLKFLEESFIFSVIMSTKHLKKVYSESFSVMTNECDEISISDTALPAGKGRTSIDERFLAGRAALTSLNLRILRQFTGLTAEELAESAQLNSSLIRSVESCHRVLQIGPALCLSHATGADVSSLLFGEILLEWGGGKPFSARVYREWVERGRRPTPQQQRNANRQLRNLCAHACDDLGAGVLGHALLAAYLHALMGGVAPSIQYEGIC